MFVIIKVFVEQVFKLINLSDLLKEQDKKAISAIGAELFALYTHLNAIYVTGLKIIEEIESTIERRNRYRREGREEEPVYFYSLAKLLQHQRRNIIWFGKSFGGVSAHLDIVDPNTARAVALFISTKINILQILIHALHITDAKGSRKALVFSASFEDDLLKAVEIAEAEKTVDVWDMNRDLLERLDTSGHDSIELHHLSEKDIVFLKNYLRTRKPGKQLEALRLILDQLHQNLLAKFELKDVLLQVGSRTPQTSTDDWVWWNPPSVVLTQKSKPAKVKRSK